MAERLVRSLRDRHLLLILDNSEQVRAAALPLAALLDACAASLKIYNSIDAPALRLPDDVARRFDLFLTGAEWQSDEIRARIPCARCLVLPIGPEFASGDTFHPTGAPKDRDVVYVACAQPYKRHDLLLDALEDPVAYTPIEISRSAMRVATPAATPRMAARRPIPNFFNASVKPPTRPRPIHAEDPYDPARQKMPPGW